MQRIKMSGFGRFLVLVAVAMFIFPLGPGISLADETPEIKIKHEPIEYYVPEKRIRLETKIKYKEKVDLVRCYFKGQTDADYVFISMAPVEEGVYWAILPAPSVDAESITYLFLVVTAKGAVVRTQEYIIAKNDEDDTPAWQDIDSGGNIYVSTELAQAPETVAGFTDSIVVDVVESAARFGFVAEGIYTLSQIEAAGGATGSAAMANGAGVVTASSGMSTAAMVGIGVGTAALVGGAVAGGLALADSSDDDEDADHDDSDTDVGSRSVTVCVQDHNNVQDDYYDLYVNGAYIGPMNNAPGGTTCHNATLQSGNNLIELRLTTVKGLGTFLQITVDPGGWSREFSDSTNHSWTITAP